MNNLKIVVTCVAGTVSGGPEALHQLVDMVNEVEPGAGAICYAPYSGSHRTFPQYEKYNIPIVMKDKIPKNAIVVFPEILADHVSQFSQRCALWWLSVDNFFNGHSSYLNKFSFHFTQSQYANEHVTSLGFNTLMLTDYINDVFDNNLEIHKNDQICVNPSKGLHLIKDFKEKNPDFLTVELTGMPREKVKEILSQSKIYIDFGHHPGRDRFPREARLSDCVVLTTKYGSAKNDIDIPISSWYKFDGLEDIKQKVLDVYTDYNYHLGEQYSYKEQIKNQKHIFKNEVKKILELF